VAKQIEDVRNQSSQSLNAKVLFLCPLNRARNEVAVAGRGTKW
jgi:hypothetical protein